MLGESSLSKDLHSASANLLGQEQMSLAVIPYPVSHLFALFIYTIKLSHLMHVKSIKYIIFNWFFLGMDLHTFI